MGTVFKLIFQQQVICIIMELFFITIFRKTYLLACSLAIIAHIAYPYLYNSPYLLAIKIVLLFIWLIELLGFILYLKKPQICPQGLLLKTERNIQTTYQTIENIFYFSLMIYIFLPNNCVFPNYLMLLVFGILLGCRIAIKSNQYLKLKE